jgi:threonyl-tRNA synthetase
MEITTLRHSLAHVLAAAVQNLFPEVKLGIGPAVENGFYYDFDSEHKFTPEDLIKIEKEMKNIIDKDFPFVRKEISKTEAKKLFSKEKYKLELLDGLDSTPTIYTTGPFVDLCAGPHVKSTRELKAFKLLRISGAYWKGDSANAQLQRIYGTAFTDKKELRIYLDMLVQAKKRDHRKLGKELDLYSFHEEAPGMPFIHPNGMVIWGELMKYWEEIHSQADYKLTKTPIILNQKLWLQSGHWDHYQENMYFTKIDKEDYAVKPMNCPGGILIYKTKTRSYRDFPLRMGEVGLVHRHELSGVLSGLFRVRSFHQDDAHIYCTEDQIESEVVNMIDLFGEVYSKFGLEFTVELSTKPEKAMGDPKVWEKAENSLAEAMKTKGIRYKINPGDGAFYGPKLDFHIRDAIGRTWQCGTIQLDFQMPDKFDLHYEGSDGERHRPVMLHRVVYGSVERFFGILVEHYAGKFPLWLSPTQVVLITVADKHNDYAIKLQEEMKAKGIRAEVDIRMESIPKKVRDNQSKKIPYMITIGDKEMESDVLAVRTRDNKISDVEKKEFISNVLKEIKDRS